MAYIVYMVFDYYVENWNKRFERNGIIIATTKFKIELFHIQIMKFFIRSKRHFAITFAELMKLKIYWSKDMIIQQWSSIKNT